MNKKTTVLVNGEVVTVWQSYFQDGSGWGIFARRHSLNGKTFFPEFQVIIDPKQQEAVTTIAEGVKSYNLSVGTYDVMVTVGPSYASKRQENAGIICK